MKPLLKLVSSKYYHEEESHGDYDEESPDVNVGFLRRRPLPLDDYRKKPSHNIQDWTRYKIFPTDFAERQILGALDRAQNETRELNLLPEDWDEEGAARISEDTSDNAMKLLRAAL
jgi:hypothetical protein